MNKLNKPLLLKQDIQKSFNSAVDTYDEAAFFQREVADRLIERLDYIRIEPKYILDLGAGTGYATSLLEKKYKKAKVIVFDIAEKMLQKSKQNKRWFDRKRYLCGDADHLPFADKSMDLIFSNLMLHWTHDIDKTIQEVHRILKPNGLFLFSTLGPDTLYELRQSWQSIDAGVHVHYFTDMHNIGDFLQKASFADSVVDMEFITITYNDLKKVLLDLKDLGTHNIAPDRSRGLTGKAKFNKFVHAYEKYRNPEGLIPVTYEVIYGLGWRREVDPLQIQEISIPIGSIQKNPLQR
ncbi:MAG: malonyl-ACP O-methyltransferase BioC [Gammaproteobacteria bacterium]|nr:malonyl-ACP O-methyltransferase BioC [Gammaproteobacteria bacterium]